MFELHYVMATHPLILSVLQPNGVVSHTQQGDDEVDQSKDAVEPQKVVPMRQKKQQQFKHNIQHMVQCFIMILHFFRTCDVIHKVLNILCTNVSQRCSPKVFRAVSCRNKAT